MTDDLTEPNLDEAYVQTLTFSSVRHMATGVLWLLNLFQDLKVHQYRAEALL